MCNGWAISHSKDIRPIRAYIANRIAETTDVSNFLTVIRTEPIFFQDQDDGDDQVHGDKEIYSDDGEEEETNRAVLDDASDVEENPEMLFDPRLFAESDLEPEPSDDPEEVQAFVSRDNTVWSENSPGPRKIMRQNVLKYQNYGPTKITKKFDKEGIFMQLFPEHMIAFIVIGDKQKG